MSKRLSDENSVWMYEDDDREDDTFTDTDLQNGLAQLITGDWGYGTEVNWESLRVQTFDNTGIMTYNKGLVITLPEGSEFQVTIVQSRCHTAPESRGGTSP